MPSRAPTWKPSTTKDLLPIAEYATARMPASRIAAALGISESEFTAWTARLDVIRSMDFRDIDRLLYPSMPPRPEEKVKILVDSIFEPAAEAAE